MVRSRAVLSVEPLGRSNEVRMVLPGPSRLEAREVVMRMTALEILVKGGGLRRLRQMK